MVALVPVAGPVPPPRRVVNPDARACTTNTRKKFNRWREKVITCRDQVRNKITTEEEQNILLRWKNCRLKKKDWYRAMIEGYRTCMYGKTQVTWDHMGGVLCVRSRDCNNAKHTSGKHALSKIHMQIERITSVSNIDRVVINLSRFLDYYKKYPAHFTICRKIQTLLVSRPRLNHWRAYTHLTQILLKLFRITFYLDQTLLHTCTEDRS